MESKKKSTSPPRQIWFFVSIILITLGGSYLLIHPPHLNAKFNPILVQQTDTAPNNIQLTVDEQIRILYISDLSNQRVQEAMELDKIINVTIVNGTQFSAFACILPQFSVIILEDIILDSMSISKLIAYNQQGGSIFFIMGPQLHNNPQVLVQMGLLNSSSPRIPDSTSVVIKNESSSNPIAANIEWNSAPEAAKFSEVHPMNDVDILLHGQFANKSEQPLLLEKPGVIGGVGSLLLSTWWLIPGYNKQIFIWFYFNYFIYTSLMHLANQTPQSYADWPYSPVPHTRERIIIGLLEVLIAFIGISAAVMAYRKSKAKPQELFLKEFATKMLEQEKTLQAKQAAKDAKLSAEKLAAMQQREKSISEQWEEVGTHRQLSGFLFGFFGGFFLLIPQIILTGFIFPRYIMPYPAIAGMYDWAKNLFAAVYAVFDLGTSVALAKYFAQYRLDKPEKAIRYVQIFIYWQMITGLFQTSLIALLGSFLFPQSYLAHMSYLFIFNSLIQFPGWFSVLIFVFQGMQRTDYQLIGNILQTAIFDLIAKYGFILIFRAIFSEIPQYGDGFGAMLGYSIGEWVGAFVTFLTTLSLFKKLGFHQSTLFRIDFRKEEIKEVLTFGSKYIIGAALVPLVHMLQAILLSMWIYNYNAEWGYFSMINTFVQINQLVNLYTQGLMSGISEAHSYKRQKLLDLNIVQGFKISNYMSFFLISALAILAEPFITGAMGVDWQGAVVYVPLLLIRTCFEPATWLGDKVFQGTGYTKEMSISWVIEQASRVIFLLIFMIPMQMMGVLLAWLLSLVLKVIYQWYTIRRVITKSSFYVWKSFIAPGIAAVINMGLLYLFRGIMFQGDIFTAIALFIIGFFLFLPIYSFLTGVLGAWDPNTLREFDKASKMVSTVGIFAREIYRMAEWGAKWGEKHFFNLHNRFIIDIYDDAIKEAAELTQIKQKLII